MDIFETTRNKSDNQGLAHRSLRPEPPVGWVLRFRRKPGPSICGYLFRRSRCRPLRIAGKLSPKILLVKPEARLSWQYHHRRAETWRVVEGPVGIVRSATDDEGELVRFEAGETIVLEKGERHRLIGLEGWGVVAEFWQHTDPDHPSDEDDIVRVQDDYARK